MGHRLTYSLVSNIGGRNVNEDAVGRYEGLNGTGFILCDGLGGHGMGDQASKLVKNVFLYMFQHMRDPSKVLPDTFQAAQDILLAEQRRLNACNKMKTTAVSLVIDEKNAYIGHIGDSRLYIFSNNKVKTRTLDHSIPQMLVASKEISESEIRHHPDRSILMRVLGTEWDGPQYEIMKPIPLKKCQAFLLCSDGFWELIEEEQMCICLKRAKSVNEWISLMNDEVRKNGIGTNMDNNSAIGVWCN